MKLGRDTGSLNNHIASRIINQPEIGMGATLLGWSDRKAATVIELFKKGKYNYVVVQQDNATRTDKNGMSDSQHYDYTPNLEGSKTTFRILENGFQKVYVNHNNRFVNTSGGVMFGERDEYYDYSF